MHIFRYVLVGVTKSGYLKVELLVEGSSDCGVEERYESVVHSVDIATPFSRVLTTDVK
jgi:hypothetical protein